MQVSLTQTTPVNQIPTLISFADCDMCGQHVDHLTLSYCPECDKHVCSDGCDCDCQVRPDLRDILKAAMSALETIDMAAKLRARHFVLAYTEDHGELLHVAGDFNKLFPSPPVIGTLLYKQLNPATQKDQAAREYEAVKGFITLHNSESSEQPWSVSVVPFDVEGATHLVSVFTSSYSLGSAY